MKQLQNKRGTTLVELIVCMVLLSILTLAAVTLIRPSAQAYRDIQLQTRAQNLADALIETIRGEVLDANGYIRFTNGATDSANLDSVFDAQTSYSDGTALEFSVYPNHVELIDKDLVPALKNSKGKDLLTQAQAEELNGYLHMRFYQQEQSDFAPPAREGRREDRLRLHHRLPEGILHGAVHQRPALLRPQLGTGKRHRHPAYHGDDGGHHSSQAGQQRQ